jgi:hypothetical protein
MAETLGWGDLRRTIEDMGKVVEDPKVLAPFAKRLREKAKVWVESQGEGAWAPFAESTQYKREHTGTSNITRAGNIRAKKLRWAEARIKSLIAKTQKRGWTDADRKRVARLRKRVATLRGQTATTQTKAPAKRKIGKTVAETTKMMPRMASTIRAKVLRVEGGAEVRVNSRAGIVGAAHQEGLGRTPKRVVIPEPTDDDLDFAMDLIEEAAAAMIEE